MKTTKLLTVFLTVICLSCGRLYSQCLLIGGNGSAQDPNSVCAPVNFKMDAYYEFLIPVDTSLVEILFRWNDGTGATTTVSGNWNAAGDSVWADASHIYPPTTECSRTAEAILVYNGQMCLSSGYQEQTFATWGTDEENSGVLSTDPVVYYVCEGEDIVDVRFDDNSTFNCNINIEPDRPNRYYRWVQFIYNTYTQSGDRIPDITVRDNSSIVNPMTDGSGNFINNLYGPIVQIPIPADGPNQTSFAISAPAGGVAGDIFEITLRNWNVCNAYDNTPGNGMPPADLLNGDNPPITTTARIEIIAPPPVTVASLFEFCTGTPMVLNANAGTAVVRWYKDNSLDTLLYTGNNFNPASSAYPINTSIAGNYRFYVTSFAGLCESAPSIVDMAVYETPQAANAGPDQTICADSVVLNGNNATVGTGLWTSSGTAVIAVPASPSTVVNNLIFGNNVFTWTITNGPCVTSDNVSIRSDRQPSPANAGADMQLCDVTSTALNANVPDLSGRGLWNVVQGSGTFADSSLASTTISGFTSGTNTLVWRVSSRYNVCPVTIDSLEIISDLSAGPANAGIDILMCEIDNTSLHANAPNNGGAGLWTLLSGSGIFLDSSDENTAFSSIGYGANSLEWKVSSTLGICPDDSDTLLIERYQTPGIANAGADKAFCLLTSDTLNGNLPAVGTGAWFVATNPSGIPPVFSPNNAANNAVFSVLPGNEGLYELTWMLQNGPCMSHDNVLIDFGAPVPPADAGKDTITCGYLYTMQGNPIATGTGTWSLLSGPGMVSFNPNINTPNALATFMPGAEGTYHFEWRLSSGSCPPTMDTVEVKIKKAPLQPSIGDLLSCGPDSFLITVPTTDPDHIAKWYSTAASTSAFAFGDSLSTGLITLNTSYFVSLYDTLTSCESTREQVNIIINQIPVAPDLYGDTLCGSGVATLTGIPALPANRVIWFADKAGLSPVDTGISHTTTTISVSDYFYARAENSLTGCQGLIDSVDVIVHPDVSAPIVYNDSSCGPATYMLNASKNSPSNTLFWYNETGTLLSISDSLLTPQIDSSISYFVAEYNPITKCLSLPAELKLIIHTLPPLPLLADTYNCGPASLLLTPVLVQEITDFLWYDSPVGGTLIHSGDSFQTPLLISSKSYWVSGYNSLTGCSGSRKEVQVKIYPPASPLNILGPTVVLKDQSNVVFFTIGGKAGSAYTWDIPLNINTEANMNDFVRLGFPNLGNYTLSVFETTINGCVGVPVYHNVTVIQDSIAVDIGNFNQGACTAENFELKPWLFGGSPPYVYQWTGDAQYLSSTNTLFTTFMPPGPGTYSLKVEVIDVNLKRTTDSVQITVYESPITTILNTDTIACVDENYTINTQSSGFGPFSHIWTGPVHKLSDPYVASPVYTTHSADTAEFSYILTDINACRAFDTINIVTDKPVADFNILTDPGCSPLPVSFQNTSTGAIKYNWYLGDNTQTTATNPQHTYVNSSPEIKYFEVKLIAESKLGCTDQAISYVMVWPNPSAELTALPQQSCNPANIMLVSTPGNSIYHWNFGDGSNDTATSRFNTYHLYTTTGFTDKTYRAQVVTQSSLNCFDTALIDITVYATPTANFAVTPEESTFPANTFALVNNTAGNWNYSWEYGDGRGSKEENPGSVSYDAPGFYTILLKVYGEHCSDSMSARVQLHPSPPIANFKGADNGCMPHTVTLVNQSEYAESYLWEFGDGSISTAKEPTYTYYQPGIYKIKLTVTGMGGVASFSDTTRVYVLPNSFFDLAPRYVYVNDEPVHYFNLSDEADVFEWDFGDGTTSTDLNPTHVYRDAGTFDVTLKVWTVNGCFDLYVMENAVFTEPSGLVEYPNAFRPDSPIEENRTFKPGIIDHVDEYNLMIFNRWGELIFESFDPEIGWNGLYKGELAKQDVYIWKVKGTYTDGKGFIKTGNVTLLY